MGIKIGNKKINSRWLVTRQSFFNLFVSFSLIEMANICSNLIDGLIVSNFYDAKSLASVAICGPMFSIFGIVSGLFAKGMQITCAQELGRGNLKDFNRIFSAVFYIAGVLSIVFMGIEFIFAEQLAALFGASGNGAELSAQAVLYIRGLAIGFPIIVISNIVSAGCQLDSGRKRVMRASFVLAGSNILLDLVAVLIKAGVLGIGLATSLSNLVALLYLLLHFRNKDRMLHFTKLDTSFKEMLKVLSFGTEKALRRLSNVIAPIFINKIIIHYGGSTAMTAMAVEKQLMDFAEFMGVGLADSTSLQIGVFYGEKDDESIREVGNLVHRYTAIFVGVITVLFLVLARPLASLYLQKTDEAYSMAVFGVCLIAPYAPLYAIVKSRITYLQAIHKTRNMQILLVFNSLIFLVLGAFILGKLFGAYGVLGTNLLCMVLSALSVWVYYFVKSKRIIPHVSDYLNLPADFHAKPGDIISIDVRNKKDISLVTRQIQLFCRGHGLDESIAVKASVCFEELAENIINFGFPMCKNNPGIDLRVVYTKDELVLRLKDNCPMFDVEKNIARALSDQKKYGKVKSMGLKVIGSISESIRYVHSLENNNVIVSFDLTKKHPDS